MGKDVSTRRFSCNYNYTIQYTSIHSYICTHLRRRIKTDAKANVVTCVWGTECIKFLAAPFILYKDDFEESDEFILFFKSSCCNSSYSSNRPTVKTASAERNWTNSAPPNSSDDLCLFVCIYPSSVPWKHTTYIQQGELRIAYTVNSTLNLNC